MPPCPAELSSPLSLRQRALAAWREADPDLKVAGVHTLWQLHREGRIEIDPGFDAHTGALETPGRPDRPHLVTPTRVPGRSAFTVEGRAAMVHAIAHIEFNAINLALDAVWRFDGLPPAYYLDWLRVAQEEALHFGLLRDHLLGLGFEYGDFDAHDGLWLMTQRTAHDVLARMALVPRTLEARGLDATPPLQAKFARAGDLRAVEILEVILRDEIGHVAIGNHWYRWLCGRAGLDPDSHFEFLVERYRAPRPRPPFNHSARRAAGFTAQELDAMEDPRARPLL